MESYLEQYEAREGGVTLHTWTDVQGAKKENFYITGISGTPIPWWFRIDVLVESLGEVRRVLRQ